MIGHKLQSLQYFGCNDFHINDSQQIRQLIAWIEDQKIRHYKIEDREALRDVDNKEWDKAFHQYLSDIECPFNVNQIPLVLDWILNLSLRLQYEDNLFKDEKKTDPQRVKTNCLDNPLDNLDFNGTEFKESVKQLADLLIVPTHPTNHLMTMRAISELIKNHISMEDKTYGKNTKTSQTVKIVDNSMPLKVGSDKVMSNSAKVLRLLYVNDLRQLQTKINEIIASVQSITANPKTDTNLGKVGV